METNRLLLIVDPQIDFISGSLPVPGAADAMDRLAHYIDHHGSDYAVKLVTSDWHPFNHCSFSHRGGEWPTHCVQHSAGAAVWQRLLDSLNRSRGGFTMLYKGDQINKDEYSIMENASSASVIVRLIAALKIDRIDICGLAGNICVLNTARDLLSLCGPDMICVLTDYAPSLDDGSELQRFVQENGLMTAQTP
ncbi:MAG: isochorismatase family protein [Prevotella sp.]|nr:isochorismatase family protein [Prevotella sp.]